MTGQGYRPLVGTGEPSRPPNQGSGGSYADEAAKAYSKLAAIIRAYDAYRARGAMPAPDAYGALVTAIDDARTIMGPQFQKNATEGR